jgi:hypothetical protein
MDDNVGQTETLRSKKATKIFVDGCQTTPEAMYTLCSTVGCFIDMMVAHPERSYLYKCFQELYNLLTAHHGKNWLNSFHGRYEGLRLNHNLIMAFNNLISVFVQIAQEPQYKAAVKNNEEIDYKAFGPALQCHHNMMIAIGDCISSISLGANYGTHSGTIRLFPLLEQQFPADQRGEDNIILPCTGTPAKRPADTTPSGTGGSKQPQGYQSPAKKPKETSSGRPSQQQANDPARDAAAKAAGFLQLSNPNNKSLPKPRHISDNGKQICMNFATKGYICKEQQAGRPCPMLHPTKGSDIPESIRNPFIAWVNSTDAITWVPGKGPPGMA